MVTLNGRKRTSGWTLVELMVTLSILSVMMMVGPVILRDITRFTRLSTAQIETQRGARGTLSLINRNLRQAKASTVVISQESGQPPYSSMTFTTYDGRTLKYYQQGRTVYQVSNGSTMTVSGELRQISFIHPRTDDPDIISVSVTFEKATYEGQSKALQMAIEKVRIMND